MRIVGPQARGHFALSLQVRIWYVLVITLVLIGLTVVIAVLQGSLAERTSLVLAIVLISVVVLPWFSLLPGRGSTAVLEQAIQESSESVARTSPWACGPLALVKRMDAWLLWINIFALMAGGVVLTTNFGNITKSRSGAHVSSASAVSVFSAAQALGRLTVGVFSDALVHRRVPRPWYFLVLSVGMAIAHLILCLSGPVALYCGTLLAGYSFGSAYPLMIVTIAELYGTERIASNYMIYDGTPVGAASLLFAKALAQWVYQRQGGGDTCQGDGCYSPTYLAVVGLQGVAVLSGCCLASKAAVVYRTSIYTP